MSNDCFRCQLCLAIDEPPESQREALESPRQVSQPVILSSYNDYSFAPKARRFGI